MTRTNHWSMQASRWKITVSQASPTRMDIFPSGSPHPPATLNLWFEAIMALILAAKVSSLRTEAIKSPRIGMKIVQMSTLVLLLVTIPLLIQFICFVFPADNFVFPYRPFISLETVLFIAKFTLLTLFVHSANQMRKLVDSIYLKGGVYKKRLGDFA